MSGLSLETMTSTGRVPPVVVYPPMSLKRERSLFVGSMKPFRAVSMCLKIFFLLFFDEFSCEFIGYQKTVPEILVISKTAYPMLNSLHVNVKCSRDVKIYPKNPKFKFCLAMFGFSMTNTFKMSANKPTIVPAIFEIAFTILRKYCKFSFLDIHYKKPLALARLNDVHQRSTNPRYPSAIGMISTYAMLSMFILWWRAARKNLYEYIEWTVTSIK